MLWQRAEGAIVFLAGLGLFLHTQTGLAWWIVIAIFFVPDISVAAYLLGRKVGAFGYNLVHIYAFGAALYVIGLISGLPMIVATGALWLAHSGFDRMLGYGLKSTEGFSVTHLGRIGRPSRE